MTTAKTALRGLAVVASAWALAGCTDWAGYDIDVAAGKVPQLATMRRSVIPDPYAMPRLPAPGTVPVTHPQGDVPAPYTATQLDSIGAVLRNPYSNEPAVLARGRVQYATNCAVCHGPAGAGNGTVVGPGKFPFAPPVNGAATAQRSDGYIYGVIDVGRGLMPPYGSRITHADRWAIVSYVRELQRVAGASGTQPPANTNQSVIPPSPASTEAAATARDTARTGAPGPAAAGAPDTAGPGTR